MSIAKLIIDEFKPYLNARVNDLVVDGTLVSNGNLTGSGLYGVVGNGTTAQTVQPAYTGLVYQPFAVTNLNARANINGFTAVLGDASLTLSGSTNPILVDIHGSVGIRTAQDIIYKLAIAVNNVLIDRSDYNNNIVEKPPNAGSGEYGEYMSYNTEVFAGSFLLQPGDVVTLVNNASPYAAASVGPVDMSSLILSVTAK